MSEPTAKQLRHYSTPADAVDVLLPHLLAWRTGCQAGIEVLEPCAGKGQLAKRLVVAGCRAHRLHMVEPVDYRADWQVDTVLCRAVARVTTAQQFAESVAPAKFDLAITNPPFDLACEVADCCLPLLRPGGQLALLNRTQFLGSRSRGDFFARVGAPHVYVLTWRPCFGVCERTDRWDYAWFVWTKGVSDPGIEWLHRPDRDAMRQADEWDGQLALPGGCDE